MAARPEHFSVNVETFTDPGTFTGVFDFPPGVITRMEVRIPRAHAGLTGIRVEYAGSPVFPMTPGTYFTQAGTTRHLDFDDPFPGGIGWFFDAFNTDPHYDHTFHVTFWLDPVTVADEGGPFVLFIPAGPGDAASVGASAGGDTGGATGGTGGRPL